MICRNCCAAGDLNAMGLYAPAETYHEQCTGCECQHKTGNHTPTNK